MKKMAWVFMAVSLLTVGLYADDYVMLSDDFEDGDYTSDPTWTVATRTWEVLQEAGGNDYLHQQLGSGDNAKIYTSFQSFSSGKFELTMRIWAESDESRTYNYFNVFVSEGFEGDSGSARSGYFVSVNNLVGTANSSGVAIRRLDDGAGVFLATADDYDCYGQWHDLKLTYDCNAVDNANLKLYLDDMETPYLTAQDDTYTTFDTVSITNRRDSRGWRFDDVNLVAQNISNIPPMVDAGLCQEITLPTNSTQLNGSVSDDGNPDPPGAVTVNWTVQSKPSGSTVSFSPSQTVLTPTATFSHEGVYILKLTGSDGLAVGEDIMSVRVLPSGYNEAEALISEVLSQYPGREASYLVNGGGLGINGAGSHANLPYATMWRSSGDELVVNEYIIFKLDGLYDLEGVRLWNYNETQLTDRGVSVLNVSVSPDGSSGSYTDIGTFQPVAEAPGDDRYDFSEIIPFTADDASYVKFTFDDNWGGGITRIGLSEVRFIGQASNLRPAVNAGDDDITWMNGGVASYQIDATVTDDGLPDPPASLQYQWTVLNAPSGATVTFDPITADIEDPLVTFSDEGTYELRLTVSDGQLTNHNSVLIDVYADACTAAKDQPGFELIPGDINEDCYVDLTDLAIMVLDWLKCNAADCQN